MILLPSHNLSVKSVARNGGSGMRTMPRLDSCEVAPATVRALYYLSLNVIIEGSNDVQGRFLYGYALHILEFSICEGEVIFIDKAITNSMSVSTGNVKSVISLEKSIFHVTSIFDKKTPLADLLFVAANEIMFGNSFLTSDFAGQMRYNKEED